MITHAWDLTTLPILPGAACKNHDPTMWEIRPGATRLTWDNELALDTCGMCPARTACARTPGVIRENVIIGGIAYDAKGRTMATVPGSDMSKPVTCTLCSKVYDLASVEVVGRYAECSAWRTPCCGQVVDDRKPPLVHRPAYTPAEDAA